MRSLVGILVVLLSVPLQVSFTTVTTGLHCDLSLVAVYFCGLYYGKTAAIASGAGLGLFLDGLSQGTVGLHLISRTVAGYAAAVTGRHVYARNPVFHFLSLLVLGSLTHAAEWFLLSLLGQTAMRGSEIFVTEVPQVLLTAGVGVVAISVALRCGFAPADLSYYPHR
jgi:rod shape-determining protein MreD